MIFNKIIKYNYLIYYTSTATSTAAAAALPLFFLETTSLVSPTHASWCSKELNVRSKYH